MPNYSSSKNAWPTFNLPNMGGGGVTRPNIRITKTKESTKLLVGPTRTAAADKARKDATMAYELRKAEARAAKKSGKRTAQEQADYDAVYAGTADAAAQARFDKGANAEAAAADKRAGSQDAADYAAERAAIKKQNDAFEKRQYENMVKKETGTKTKIRITKTKTSKTKHLKTGPEYFGGEKVRKKKTFQEEAQQ